MSCNSEYPLFIPRPTFCNIGETSWSDKSSSNFGVASMESVRKPHLDSSCSFNCASASPHSIEKHKDLQKGISLIKKSVACVTAYCYNSLRLDVPTEASTFEALARLLAILSSSKEMQYVCSIKAASSRYLTHVLSCILDQIYNGICILREILGIPKFKLKSIIISYYRVYLVFVVCN